MAFTILNNSERGSHRPLAVKDRFVLHSNKAHTATANRIAMRYHATYNDGDGIDISSGDLFIEVETTATVAEGVLRLQNLTGRLYVAVTNKEGVTEALKATEGTNVGVMDPRGNIVREST